MDSIFTVFRIVAVGIGMTFAMLVIFYLLIKFFGQTVKNNKE